MPFSRTKVLFTHDSVFTYPFYKPASGYYTWECCLHTIFTCTKAFGTHESAFCIRFYTQQSAFYTWERLMHMHFTRTRALFTHGSAFCTHFLHATKHFLHMRALVAYALYTCQSTFYTWECLFAYAFYTHQSVFYKWEHFLRKLFTCTKTLSDDDCFDYHSWVNNVVIAFGTLVSVFT